MNWVYDDGGRAAAGYKGSAGDCGVRAIAIAVGHDYAYVYDRAFDIARHVDKPGRSHSPRDGFSTKAMHAFMAEEHWKWTPTMSIGSGTQVHLRADELPTGRLIARCSKHYVAVIDGVIHDTGDPSRGGTRAVYGYWAPAPVRVSAGALALADGAKVVTRG